MDNTTILVKRGVKEKFDELRDFVSKDFNNSDFLNYLIDSHPKMIEFVTHEQQKKLKEEWVKENEVTIKCSFEEFKRQKLKEF